MAQLLRTTNCGGHHTIIPSCTKLMSISVLPSLSSNEVEIVSPKNTITFSGWCGIGKEISYKDVPSSNNSPFHDVLGPQLDCLANKGILLLLLGKSGGKINVEL
jgi:hypothetical protein